MAMMFLLMGGQNARNFFSAYVPAQYLDLIEQKKWMVGIATFFLGNQLQNMITSTGAFEVFVNGNLVRKLHNLYLVTFQIKIRRCSSFRGYGKDDNRFRLQLDP